MNARCWGVPGPQTRSWAMSLHTSGVQVGLQGLLVKVARLRHQTPKQGFNGHAFMEHFASQVWRGFLQFGRVLGSINGQVMTITDTEFKPHKKYIEHIEDIKTLYLLVSTKTEGDYPSCWGVTVLWKCVYLGYSPHPIYKIRTYIYIYIW